MAPPLSVSCFAGFGIATMVAVCVADLWGVGAFWPFLVIVPLLAGMFGCAAWVCVDAYRDWPR